MNLCMPIRPTVSPLCLSPGGAAGGVLRGDDAGAGQLRHAHRLPAEQLQGAAAAVHGPGVRLVHRSGGSAHAKYVTATKTQPDKECTV